MIVMKFGGTSVGSADAMRQVAEIVKRALPQKPAVVVSAVSKVTDLLLDSARAAQKRTARPEDLTAAIAERHGEILSQLSLRKGLLQADLTRLGEALRGIYLLRELTPRSLDYVLSYGEILSSKIVAALLEARGVPARAWTGWEAGVLTDETHGEAQVLPQTFDNIRKNLFKELGKRVPIITGFLGKSRSGQRTTLGRGGSDYSAAIVGRALGAKEIQIWTDVPGIMSCDPRIVKDAFTIRYITFAEAAELSYFGAKVLHPKTVEPAMDVGIPVRIVNTFSPDDPGTLVVKKSTERDERVVEGLAVKRANFLVNLTSTRMLDAEGYLAEVFGVLARHDVGVDCVATSEVSVSVTVDKRYETELRASLRELRRFARVNLYPNRSLISMVGEGMLSSHGMAGEAFGVVTQEKVNVELISQGASELNLSFVVKDQEADRVLRALHRRFLVGKQRTEIPKRTAARKKRPAAKRATR